ncbi:DUF1906 domain-containing protein [Kitasatospora sp. NPDC087315]|uniref:DUF1906 domain-containing protein n=1 Tax=Kitasatospora sp. NPDC087315 TaxID=3364069 RepID=UPI003809C849
MRYLRSAALVVVSLALLLATDGAGVNADTTALAAAAPRIRATVLPDWAGPPALRARDLYTGAAFDACTAPPLDTLRAWRGTSPYGAVGIYTSGGQRGCDQPRLTADWVRQVRAMGWRFIPVHVGLQAPCSGLSRKPRRIDPNRAVQQGRDEAAEAVRGLSTVGLGEGSPVFLDIEAYPARDPGCGQAVVDFTLGWTQTLHAAGYRSGFYSSLDSGIADLAAAARAGSSPLPDSLWYARWDDRADTVGGGPLGAELWTDHQRVHQYHGNIEETYGGATLTVDRNHVDTPLAG